MPLCFLDARTGEYKSPGRRIDFDAAKVFFKRFNFIFFLFPFMSYFVSIFVLLFASFDNEFFVFPKKIDSFHEQFSLVFFVFGSIGV